MGTEILGSDPEPRRAVPLPRPSSPLSPTFDLDEATGPSPPPPGLRERFTAAVEALSATRRRRTLVQVVLALLVGGVAGGLLVAAHDGRVQRARLDRTVAVAVRTSAQGSTVDGDVVLITVEMSARNLGPRPVRLLGVDAGGGSAVRVVTQVGLDHPLGPGQTAQGSLTVGLPCGAEIHPGAPAGVHLLVQTRDGASHQVLPLSTPGGLGVDDLADLHAVLVGRCSPGQPEADPGLDVSLDGGSLLISWDPTRSGGFAGGRQIDVTSGPGLEMLSSPQLPLVLPPERAVDVHVRAIVRACAVAARSAEALGEAGAVLIGDGAGGTRRIAAPPGFAVVVGRTVQQSCGG